MNLWEKLFARGRYELPERWDSLMSFSVVVPFSREHMKDLKCSLEEAARFRSAFADICRPKYFPDPLYEELRARIGRSEEPSNEERKYLEGRERYFEELAIEKIGIALVYEEPQETLSNEAVEALREISKPYPECRVLAFSEDMLIVNGGARYLISTGHYTWGFKTFILEPNQKLSKRQLTKSLVDMLRDEWIEPM